MASHDRSSSTPAARPPSAWRLLPPTFSGYRRAWLGPDVVAGLTLAAVAVPECMGYTKIAGMPVVTGLYTILLPIAVFALLGSSRHLVVGADSATAAILFAGLSALGRRPGSGEWVAMASASALLTAIFLFAARVFRLGFLANFLSRTVLVGFLSGVGVSLLVGQLPDMLGVHAGGDFVRRLRQTVESLPRTNAATLGMSLAVLAVIMLCARLSGRLPGALIAVVLAIVATWAFHLGRFGISTVGRVEPGLPALGLPHMRPADALRLFWMSASMFLVVLAQSAATSRSFAQADGEPLDEDRDLLALGAANLAAGLSGTFVVNGSPTKTAVVVAAGGRTQAAQLTTALVVLAVLLFATGPIEHLPEAALAAVVFRIGARLIDLRSLRRIYHFRKGTFAVASATLGAVVLLGVERGIFIAIGLSILDHLRREYHPKDVVLAPSGGRLKAIGAEGGVETEPGLIAYRFQAPLFFANADYFSARLREIVADAPHRVKWLVLDLVSMDDIDYTGGLALKAAISDLRRSGVTVAFAQAEDVRNELELLGITARGGPTRFFDSVLAAVEAYRAEAGQCSAVTPSRMA